MSDIRFGKWLIRLWAPSSLQSIWWNLSCWLSHGFPRPFEFSMRTIPGLTNCYCPYGSTTEIHAVLLGFGCWAWLTRDRVRRPCLCDKTLWWLHPDLHDEEIAEYGRERFSAEFPGQLHGNQHE